MRVLGIDTSQRGVSVVVAEPDQVLAGLSQTNSKSPSSGLMPLVEKSLELSGLTLEQIDLIGVAIGPGSFTGIRVGIGCAMGLKSATGLPTAGIDSLDAMVWALPPWDGGYTCPMAVSRLGEVYSALYTLDGGLMIKVTDDMALEPEALVDMLDRPARFTGSGFLPSEGMIRARLGALCEYTPLPKNGLALGVARLCFEKDIEHWTSGGCIVPKYANRPQAQVNRDKTR